VSDEAREQDQTRERDDHSSAAITSDPQPSIAADNAAMRYGLDDETFEALRKTWKPPASWLKGISAVQNGPVAKRYFVLVFLLFLAAGSMALLMRIQLAVPRNDFLLPDQYNALFTMHGSTMMYLVAVPLLAAFATLLLPQMIGTRDMPFPRMTALGWWAFLFGVIFLYISYFFAVPKGGWFAYVPLTTKEYMPDKGMDFWLLGLGLIEVASLGTAIEFIVAILKTRAPGMSLNRIPILAWAVLAMGLMMLFGFTPLLVGTTFLELDRLIGTRFFHPEFGGNPILWQHLFWIFGHPEVYIQFLPASGVISMLIPALSRRPLVAYTGVVMAIMGTAVMSFGLWVHHMYTVGMPLQSMSFFTASSLVIGVFSGIQVFAWIATIWGGRPVWNTAMWFTIGTIVTFVAGGLTGIMVGIVPFDWQVHDTYFVVAHFHYVLIGGVIFPLFAAFYFWLPKVTGRLFSERLGKWNFWLTFIGFHATFLPMHLTGLLGMPRRVYTYHPDLGWDLLNLVSTVAAFLLGAGSLVFVVNFFYTIRYGEKAGQNPWNAGTLEWATPMPLVPPPFFLVPIIRGRYPLWDQERFDEGDERTERAVKGLKESPTDYRAILITTVADAEPQAIVEIPGPTYTPLYVGLALAAFFTGVISGYYWIAAIGAAATALALALWHWPRRATLFLDDEGPVMLHGLPVHTTGLNSTGWWAMFLIVLILAISMATFLLSYFFYRVTTPVGGAGAVVWPPSGIELPKWGLSSVTTMLMLAAVAAMGWADIGIARGRRRRLVIGLVAAEVLGAVFMVLQILLYRDAGFSHDENAYASIFLMTLAFHIAMTAAGLLMALPIGAQAWLGYFNRWRRSTVQILALYWYFLAASWALTFVVLYLSPYWI
tara:strand:- start:9831 stop:12467 length:2637 start_codon:yes stop_codon:yes gene_type:complete